MTATVRYVAGLAPHADDMHFAVLRLVEDDDGERIAQPVFVIGDMTREQTEHLHLQLGRALGISDE